MSGWIWAILGLLLILLEFFVPQFVIFFFGVGALLTAAITALVPGHEQLGVHLASATLRRALVPG